MSSVYTGVGGNVSQSTSPTITVPADGDSLAVTSVNVAMDKLMDYIALIFAGAFTGQTSSTPGLAGTGGASAQGGKFTAGGGSSPVKGEVNLVPTTNAPSSADNGDLWMTTAGVYGVKANGNVRTVGVLEAAQTWTGTQTGVNFAKAWAVLQCSTAGAVSILGTSFNIASASYSGTLLTVNFTSAVANANYAAFCVIQAGTGIACSPTTQTTSSFQCLGWTSSTGSSRSWANLDTINVIVFDN